jgi:hypothetical protein
MTVHKTQGMTLDSMVLHLNGAFDYGQAYVGLSRARSLDCLEVRGFRRDLVKAHDAALAFYRTCSCASSLHRCVVFDCILNLCLSLGDLSTPSAVASASGTGRGSERGDYGGGGGGGAGGRTVSASVTAASTIGDGVFVAPSKLPNAGRGLFADKAFCKNDVITEYGGEVIDAKEGKRRRAKGQSSHIRSLVPMHACIDGRLVSASSKGEGGASFINDPLRAKLYNCKFVVKQADQGVVRTGLSVLERCFVVALCDIRKGDELYVSYGNDYWVDVFTNKR